MENNGNNKYGLYENIKLVDTTNAPYIITICSGKGGVGKSILTANLSRALSKVNNRVLIWDADMSFPNQHLLNGVEPPVRLKDVYKLMIPIDKAQFKLDDNLHIMADSPATGSYESFDPSLISNVYEQLAVQNRFDVVLIDTPAGNSLEVLQCCSFSDMICVVITDEPTSLLDAYGLIKILINYIEIDKIKLFVNNVIDLEDADDISAKLNLATENFLKMKFEVLGFIPYDRSVRQSILQQEPFILSNPEAEASQAIDSISKKLNDQYIRSLSI